MPASTGAVNRSPWILIAFVNALFCGLGGVLSDRFGRRRILLAANTIGTPWALLLFTVLRRGYGRRPSRSG